jgi:hypothetical protein
VRQNQGILARVESNYRAIARSCSGHPPFSDVRKNKERKIPPAGGRKTQERRKEHEPDDQDRERKNLLGFSGRAEGIL